jgi:cell wall-associated NlpC family hydrolase
MTDGVAGVQTRIQEIQQRFAPQPASSTSGTTTDNQTFAEMLSAAASLGTDGTGDGATSSSPLAALLTGLNGGTGLDTGALGSTGLGGTDSLLSMLGAGGTSPSTTSGLSSVSSLLGSIGTTSKSQTFLQNALAQAGDPYVWGASASPTDPNPKAFDCSELVKWAAKRAGVDLPDGSWLQYLQLQQQGATIPVQQALQTPGALLFSFSQEPTPGGGRPAHAHVAISLGNGRTIEARGRSYGVGSFDAGNRFQYAAVIPGLAA